jgi:hypothetical protein
VETSLQLVQPLGDWTLTLHTGEVIVIHAHAVEHLDIDEYVFCAYVEGTPVDVIEIARVPKSIVSEWHGG